jgi:hypothetical protein
VHPGATRLGWRNGVKPEESRVSLRRNERPAFSLPNPTYKFLCPIKPKTPRNSQRAAVSPSQGAAPFKVQRRFSARVKPHPRLQNGICCSCVGCCRRFTARRFRSASVRGLTPTAIRCHRFAVHENLVCGSDGTSPSRNIPPATFLPQQTIQTSNPSVSSVSSVVQKKATSCSVRCVTAATRENLICGSGRTSPPAANHARLPSMASLFPREQTTPVVRERQH